MPSRRRFIKKKIRRRRTRKQRGGNNAVVVFTLTNSAGFGSVTNCLCGAYIRAKVEEKEFFIENSGWQYGKWHDYFKSLKCFDASVHKNVTRYSHPALDIAPYSLKQYSDAIQDIFVLNDDLEKRATEFIATMAPSYKAIYVRRGDKTSGGGKEMDAIHIPDLLKTTDIVAGDNLFVQTDDYSVVDEIKSCLPGTKVFTLTPSEAKGADGKVLLTMPPETMKEHANELFVSMRICMGCSKGWVDNRSNLGRFMKMSALDNMNLYPSDASTTDLPLETLVSPPHDSLKK